MPRAPARIRKRYIEGQTDVCPWDTEETLLYGLTPVFGPPSMFKRLDEWRREWSRWRDVILPKCIEHRPGTRPFAMYATGEIPRRELRIPLPQPNAFWKVDVFDTDDGITTHYLDVPEPFIEREVKHLHRLGIVDDDELRRHREWARNRDPDCEGGCMVDSYPLEMSLHE